MSQVNDNKVGTNIQFKRRRQDSTSTEGVTLKTGEPFYNAKTKQLFIGNSDSESTATEGKKHIAEITDNNEDADDAKIEFNIGESSNTYTKTVNNVAHAYTATSDESSNNIKATYASLLSESEGTLYLTSKTNADLGSIKFDSGTNQGEIKVEKTDVSVEGLSTTSTPTFSAIKLGDDTANTLTQTQYSGNAATATSVDIENNNEGDNAVVSFQVGEGAAYEKTINNVAHANTASKILIENIAYTLSLNGVPAEGQITFITN